MLRRWICAFATLALVAGVLLLTPFACWADTGERLILGSAAADIAVTEMLRARGHGEANDWQQNRVAGYAIKGAAKWLTVGFVALSGAAVSVSLIRAR